MSEGSRLLELQEIDLGILRATKRLEELPERRAILECRAKRREVAVLQQKAAALVHKLESEVKARQDEISTLAEKIAGEQVKLMNTSDHRQVQAITREMDGLKRRVDKVEMEELQFMERGEKGSAQADTIAEHALKLEKREAELIASFQKVGGAIQIEIAQFQKRRESIAPQMEPKLLEQYETLRAARGGIAVGRYSDGECSACRMELPLEGRKKLLSGPEVGTCPECRRLIVDGQED